MTRPRRCSGSARAKCSRARGSEAPSSVVVTSRYSDATPSGNAGERAPSAPSARTETSRKGNQIIASSAAVASTLAYASSGRRTRAPQRPAACAPSPSPAMNTARTNACAVAVALVTPMSLRVQAIW